MRHFRILITAITVIASALSASAQLRFGIKAGVGVNSLKATEIEYVKDNSTGFSAGVMADFTVPIIGIGVDASVMYAHRSTPVNVAFMQGDNDIMVEATMADKNYLEVPVNLKYALSLPAISNIVKPFLSTGPCVAFNLSGKAKETEMDIKKANLSWNLGAGVEMVKHLQLSFNYRWGLGGLNKSDLSWTTRQYDLKCNGWNITAAYLF